MSKFGVISRGIICPMIRKGDDIAKIVAESTLDAMKNKWIVKGLNDTPSMMYDINDNDVIGITESVVARAKGLFISVDDIAADIEKKFGKDATICLVNPIYSRNRFSMILKGIARASKKVIVVMPDYDEVGNPRGVNPFTGVNIEEYYKELCESENCEFVSSEEDYHYEIITDSADYVDGCIFCGLHNYTKFKNSWLVENYDDRYKFYTLADICSDKSPDWGVLGTNKSTDEVLKLFPSKEVSEEVCNDVKTYIKEATGKDVIVVVYGDGCFKDPVGKIWEFADPTTMPGYTNSELIETTPNEVKLKYFIDTINDNTLSQSELTNEVNEQINEFKKVDLKGKMSSQGTTPRIRRDLIASLMDLTSGSGDRATPVVLVQNYF